MSIDVIRNIEDSNNFITKKISEEEEIGLQIIVSGEYNYKTGYTSRGGSYCFSLIDVKTNQEIDSIKSSNYDKTGFYNSFDTEDSSVRISFYSEDNSWKMSQALSLGVEGEKRLREVGAHNLKDLDYLYDEYLFPNLMKILDVKNYEQLFESIKNGQLEDEVGCFISDIVDTYNQSYLKHKEEIEKYAKEFGYSQAHFRFGICTKDEEFIENMQNSIEVFKTAIISKELTNSNVRGNKSMSFLDNIKVYEKALDSIADELVYRSNMSVSHGSYSNLQMQKSASKEAKRACKNFKEEGLITDKERQRISELEKRIFTGQISENEKLEYKNISRGIQRRYALQIVEFQSVKRGLDWSGFFESSAMHYRQLDGTKGISNLGSYMEELESDFEAFMNKQSNELDAQIVLAQNSALEGNIGKLVETDSETGEILLDTEKRAVAKKIYNLKKISSRKLWLSQARRLFENNVPNLKNIVFKAETLSGLKDFYLNGVEEASRQRFFGQHYHYLTTEDFYKKILELEHTEVPVEDPEEVPESRRSIVEALNQQILAAYHQLNSNLTHKVGSIDKVKDSIQLVLRTDPAGFLTDDGEYLDIRKILQERSKLMQEINGLRDNSVEKSEMAAKIVFIDERLLNPRVGREDSAVAVSFKDYKAFEILCTLEDCTTKVLAANQNIESADRFDKEIISTRVKHSELEEKKTNIFTKGITQSKINSLKGEEEKLNAEKNELLNDFDRQRQELEQKAEKCADELLETLEDYLVYSEETETEEFSECNNEEEDKKLLGQLIENTKEAKEKKRLDEVVLSGNADMLSDEELQRKKELEGKRDAVIVDDSVRVDRTSFRE